MGAPESQPPSQELAELADATWEDRLAADPLLATQLGDRRYDDRLPDLSPSGLAANRSTLAALLRRTRALPADRLPPGDRITQSALAAFLDAALALLEATRADWVVDPVLGPHLELLQVPTYQRVDDPGQGRALVARWQAMGGYLDRYVANLRAGLAGGRAAAAALVRKPIAQLDGLLGTPLADWPLAEPLRDGHPDWTIGERERFAAGVEDAVRDTIRPAFARLREMLATEVLPRARPDSAVGISQVPGGAEEYARLIRAHTGLDGDPERIHQLGLAELERIHAELAELGSGVLGVGRGGDAGPAAGRGAATVAVDAAETLRRLRSDPALRFTDRAELLATAEAVVRRAEAALPDWFGLRPQEPCQVLPLPAHGQDEAPPAYYRPGAADGSRPGRFYVNTAGAEKRARFEAEALAFHEAVPGHHLQSSIAAGLDGLPAFRRYGGNTAYVEGWGLYAERLADEMGLYSSALDRLGLLSFDAWRASRLVADTGLHAFGWSRDRAIDLLLRSTSLIERDAVNEVDRYIAWPAQALAYKIGQLELARLREQARSRLGPAFDLRLFHDAVLGEGELPLPTLRAVVESALA